MNGRTKLPDRIVCARRMCGVLLVGSYSSTAPGPRRLYQGVMGLALNGCRCLVIQCGSPALAGVRRGVTSRIGGAPNIRRYSRLNCVALS